MQEYFFLDQQNLRQGPYAGEQLAAHGVTATTLVWCQGMADWKPAGQVPELASVFSSASAPFGGSAASQGAPVEPVNNPYAKNYQPKPDNGLVWAVLATICCCTPLGIVAIYKAAKVNPYFEGGLYAQARQAAGEAKKWAVIAAVCGIVFLLLYWGFIALVGTSLPSMFSGM